MAELEDDKDYFIWFAFEPQHKPAKLSLAFTFAHVAEKDAEKDYRAFEKALGLRLRRK